MVCLSIPELRCFLLNYITRLFSLSNLREIVLFGGLDPNRDSLSDLLEADIPKEQPTISANLGSSVSTRDLEPIRLYVCYPFLLVKIKL
jgi:hypothetical protein